MKTVHDQMHHVYVGDAWGRRRLRDWESMPSLMRVMFYTVDSKIAGFLWLALLCAAFGLVLFNIPSLSDPYNGSGAAVLAIIKPLVLIATIALVRLLLRIAVQRWYEGWRRGTKH